MKRPSQRLILTTVLCAFVLAASSLGQAEIPKPETLLGYQVGADFKLASYDDSIQYFRQLDAASDYLQLHVSGRTSEGRPWYIALISTPENLANVQHYRQIAQQLAHPKTLTDEEARQLAREGKALVDLNGGLHASEVAGAQHTIQLAYDLLSNVDDPRTRAILDNVVLLLWPSLNPDGQNIVVDWYRSNVGTPYEVAPLKQLYQKYVGHDNNRDAYMLNMIESRVIERTWRHWEPQIIYVHHQTAPFPTRIWLPPFAEPIGSEAPPLMSRTVNSIGMAIAHGLESKGQPGATHMGTGYDAWYAGYVDYLPMFKNIAAYWTETALYRYATPRLYTLEDFRPGDRSLRAESLYPSPWKGGWWRLRDAVDYMITASLSTLDYAAKYKYDLLYNRYQAGRDTIRKYEQEPPYAYFIPQDQRDPVAPVELLRRLAFGGIEVYQTSQAFRHDGLNYPRGTWVIPMNQEFAPLVREVLDIHSYPDLREYPQGPPEQPYDAAGWTLPFMMGVEVTGAGSPLSPELRKLLEPVQGRELDWQRADSGGAADASPFDSVPGVGFDTSAAAAGIIPLQGKISGSGEHLWVNPAENNSFRAINQALKSGGAVRFVPPEGDSSSGYAISGISGSGQQDWVRDLALQARRTDQVTGPAVQSRIALYQPFQPSMDEGWTRWLLESYGFSFTSVGNADFHRDTLRDRFDVILLADIPARGILNGFAKGTVPPRYEGGLGAVGARNLDAFVRAGGTLVCLNNSSAFAIEQLHLPVRNVVAGLDRKDYFVGSSILHVTVDDTHPVMAGMPRQAQIFSSRSPIFTTLEGFSGTALAKYQQSGSPLASGYLLGEKHIQGHAAALDVYHGDGHVVLLGFRPQWRGQSFGTFKVLFNAALYGGELAMNGRGDADFWAAPELQK